MISRSIPFETLGGSGDAERGRGSGLGHPGAFGGFGDSTGSGGFAEMGGVGDGEIIFRTAGRSQRQAARLRRRMWRCRIGNANGEKWRVADRQSDVDSCLFCFRF